MLPLNTEQTKLLFDALLSLKDAEECGRFLEDLCTIKELEDMAQRLSVAAGLLDGNTFAEIGKKTGASSATISRVNKCIMYGSGGYREVIAKLRPVDKTETEG